MWMGMGEWACVNGNGSMRTCEWEYVHVWTGMGVWVWEDGSIGMGGQEDRGLRR